MTSDQCLMAYLIVFAVYLVGTAYYLFKGE